MSFTDWTVSSSTTLSKMVVESLDEDMMMAVTEKVVDVEKDVNSNNEIQTEDNDDDDDIVQPATKRIKRTIDDDDDEEQQDYNEEESPPTSKVDGKSRNRSLGS
jgi:hypothetical protein